MRMRGKLYFIIGGIVAGLLLLTAILLLLFLPSSENAFPYEDTPYQAVINGQVRTDVKVLEGERYYSYSLVKEGLDPYLWWDGKTSCLTVTTGDGMDTWSVMEAGAVDGAAGVGETAGNEGAAGGAASADFDGSAGTGELMGVVVGDALTSAAELSKFVDGQSGQLACLIDGVPYLSEQWLDIYYGVTPVFVEENQVSVWLDEGLCMGWVTSLKDTLCIRQTPSIKAPRVQVLEECKGQSVASVLESAGDGWFQVVSTTGVVGFVQESHVSFEANPAYTGTLLGVNREIPGSANGRPTFVTEFADKKISMVWEAVYSYNPDVSAIGPMEGLDVIAPTWFELQDVAGTMSCMASADYVTWAHAQGYAVWGTVTSCFTDPLVTSAMLHDSAARMGFVRQLMDYALQYNLDGINVDFENMVQEDKMLFTQFVRELSVLCHENGLVLSCDITALSDSSYWSLCYDRPSLAASVDYVCVMLYDQHASGSQVAGSVSQLSWTEASLQRLLQQIPAEKIILGMPFYTRLWQEVVQADGSVSVTSSVLYMEDAQALLNEKSLIPEWDSESGQYYVSYTEGGATYKLWLEDATSIKGRVALVSEYDLAGCAAWRRGFETADVWGVIAEGLG